MADEKLDLTGDDVPEDADAVEADVSDAADNVFDTVEETVTEAETEEDFVGEEDTLEDHEDTDVRGQSLSSKILTWLVLMAIGAGLVLWGGPKIAPNLPGWASPVARILTPGGDRAIREVEALRSDVATRLEALPEPVDAAALETAAQSAAAQGDAALTERLDALEAQLGENPQSDMVARLSTLETRFEGVAAEVASLNKTLSEAITSGGDMSAETLAQLAAKDAVIDGLKAELNQISGQMGALNQRIDEVDRSARTRAEEILTEAQMAEQQAALLAKQTAFQKTHSDLVAAAQSGRSFQAELDAFAAQNDGDVQDLIAANAQNGLPSIFQLEEEFSQASHLAIRASIKSEAGDGTLSKVSAFFQSQVATRSLAPKEGDTADAILSRMSAAVSSGDMSKVLSEAEKLGDTARAPLTGFLNKARLRYNVLSAIDALGTQAS